MVITRGINKDTGFEELTVTPVDGGFVKIVFYGEKLEFGVIGLFSLMNKNGLGYSNYIVDRVDIKNFIYSILRCTWLHDYEKNACIEFLNWIRDNMSENIY